MYAALMATMVALAQEDMARKLDEAVQRAAPGGFWGVVSVATGKSSMSARHSCSWTAARTRDP